MNELAKKILSTDYVHIEDHFLSFYDELLGFINESDFVRKDNALYGGKTLELSEEFDFAIQKKMQDLLGTSKIEGYGRVRQTTTDDDGTDQTFIHLDFNCLVLIIYLTDMDFNKSLDEKATTFYSHKFMKRKKMSDKSQTKNYISDDMVMRSHYKDYDQWDRWLTIEPKKNRAIIFDGHLFHSGPRKFTGNKLDDSRMTIDYFFNRNILVNELGK